MAYATENQNLVDGQRTAAADLSANQFALVKIAANGQIALVAAATDEVHGVLTNAPRAGEEARVVVQGITKINCGGTVTEGGLIGPTATAEVGPVQRSGGGTAGIPIIGKALAAGVDGDVVTCAIDCTNPPATAV